MLNLIDVYIKYISHQFACPTGFSGRVATQLMNIFNGKMYQVCSNIISEFSDQRILDIGFGNGYMLHIIQQQNNDNDLYGVEISNDALRLAKRRLGIDSQLFIGTAEKLNFENCFFNVIYTINTFYFWQNPSSALTEVKRTLAVGGLFINICYKKEWLDKLKYTKYEFNKKMNEDIVQLHIEAGFSSVELKVIEQNKSFYIMCTK
ncbi:MAG: class I SAM-dependent methyltransferase [Bacteroides sp.]